jgi:hypothetical protein
VPPRRGWSMTLDYPASRGYRAGSALVETLERGDDVGQFLGSLR